MSGQAVVEPDFPFVVVYVKCARILCTSAERAYTDVTNEHITPQCCPRSQARHLTGADGRTRPC